MKSHARVVVIGGGAMGVGLLYHLAKEGWNDVMLIEKGELTSGSTWHAAGLVPHFIGSLNMAKVHRYGSELYQVLEEETGHYLGHEQTLSRMQSDYLYPELGDRENINNWIDQGSSNIEERASERAREIIESHFPDHIDPEIEMRIRSEFSVRIQSGPSQTIEPRVA